MWIKNGEFVIALLTDVGALAHGEQFKGKYAVLPEIVVAGIALPSVTVSMRRSGSQEYPTESA